MAKTYRKATEKDISKGKGKSTDELSLAEATAYFNKRAGETGAKKFRYKGEVYDLSGEKAPTAAPKSSATESKPSKPATPQKVVNTVRPEAPSKSRTTGGGGADHMPATGSTTSKKSGGRGDGASEVGRRKADATRQRVEKMLKDEASRKAKEESSNTGKRVAAGAVVVGIGAAGVRAAMDKAATARAAARAAATKPPAASATTPSPAERAAARLKLAADKKAADPAKPAPKTTVTVPKYNNIGVSVGRNWVPESAFTDKPTPPKKSETKSIAPPKKGGPRVGQSKAAAPTVARGAGGGVRAGGPVKPRRIGGGGVGQAAIDRALNPFNFSKGGMVKKDKK